jgi:hypothetical protein
MKAVNTVSSITVPNIAEGKGFLNNTEEEENSRDLTFNN